MKNDISINERKRKALLALPLIVIPLLTMAFWALGGGKVKGQKTVSSSGLNMQLPSPHLKDDKDGNKLSFYAQADKDSMKWRETLKNDPLYEQPVNWKDSLSSIGGSKRGLSSFSYALKGTGEKDPNEEKVYQKLAELNQQLKASTSSYSSYQDRRYSADHHLDNLSHRDNINSIATEKMNTAVANPAGDDPELKQLNGMMDKILDIQHPERISDRRESGKEKQSPSAYHVDHPSLYTSVSLLDTGTLVRKDQFGFYSVSDSTLLPYSNAIEAVVDGSQTPVNGAVVKLKLLSDLFIHGKLITKGCLIFGLASLSGERLKIEIPSIRAGNTLFPVQLEVYDMDGLEGIYIPNAITREVAQSSVDQATQMLELTSLDPSLKAQAASAGVNMAKTLISKKAKLMKVTIKDGYKVLLYNKQTGF